MCEKCAKTRVIQNSILYNFCFLRFFILRSSFHIHVTHHPDYQTCHDGQLVGGTLYSYYALRNDQESVAEFGNMVENKTCWECDSLQLLIFWLFDFGTDISRISVISAHFGRDMCVFAHWWTFLKPFPRVVIIYKLVWFTTRNPLGSIWFGQDPSSRGKNDDILWQIDAEWRKTLSGYAGMGGQVLKSREKYCRYIQFGGLKWAKVDKSAVEICR